MAVKYDKLTPRAFENAISRLLNHEELSHNDRCAIADYALTELRRQCGEESPEYVGGISQLPEANVLALANRWADVHTDESHGIAGKNLGILAREVLRLSRISPSE